MSLQNLHNLNKNCVIEKILPETLGTYQNHHSILVIGTICLSSEFEVDEEIILEGADMTQKLDVDEEIIPEGLELSYANLTTYYVFSCTQVSSKTFLKYEVSQIKAYRRYLSKQSRRFKLYYKE